MRTLTKDEQWLFDRLSSIAKAGGEESIDARNLRNKLIKSGLNEAEEKLATDLIYGE
jgi:hypothetical protein